MRFFYKDRDATTPLCFAVCMERNIIGKEGVNYIRVSLPSFKNSDYVKGFIEHKKVLFDLLIVMV